MSGGTFDYQQHRIFEMAESVKDVLEQNNSLKTYESLNPWDLDKETGRICPGTKVYVSQYSPETLKNLLLTYRYLRLAYEFAHQADLLLAGDTGEETFNSRVSGLSSKIENDVAELWEKVLTKEPDAIDRCIFCKTFGSVAGIPVCRNPKGPHHGNRIADPLQQKCPEFSRVD